MVRRLTSGEEGSTALELTPVQMQIQGNLELMERLATNPDVNLAVLDKLSQMQTDLMAKAAEMSFNDAMSACQEDMRAVKANKKNTHLGTKYPTYEALDAHLRPLYTKYGFSVSFDTGQGNIPEPVKAGEVRVWLILSHKDGHKELRHTDVPLPTEGAQGGKVMTKTQGVGGAMSYGSRYLLKFAFNIAVGEDDKDGNPPTGGQDHRYKTESVSAPRGKSEAKSTGSASQTGARNPLKPASSEADKISASNVKTLEATMKRSKPPITMEQFLAEFGIPLNQVSKHDLNTAVVWIQEEGKK